MFEVAAISVAVDGPSIWELLRIGVINRNMLILDRLNTEIKIIPGSITLPYLNYPIGLH